MKYTKTLFDELEVINKIDPVDLVDLKNLPKIDPEWLTGFSDGEACFYMNVYKTQTKAGYRAEPSFFIKQEKASANVLFAIKEFFGKGNIRWNEKSQKNLRYEIKSVSAINEKVVPFFDKYQLITSKRLNFLDMKKILRLFEGKKHLTPQGLEEIMAIKSNMNLGRSYQDKLDFMNSIKDTIKINPGWLSGFIDAEGHFKFYVKDKQRRRCELSFSISQNDHDLVLLKAIGKYLGGTANTFSNIEQSGSVAQLPIYRLETLTEKVVPLIEQYPLITNKHKDFVIWKEVLNKMVNKEHLTPQGFEEIRKLMSQIRQD